MNTDYYWYLYLCHSGIKGQKWGERRYRNYDGTLTEEGKRRYHPSTVDSQGKAVRAGNALKRAAKATGRGIGIAAKATGRGLKKVGKGIGTSVKNTVKKKKPVSSMTDDELAEHIARIRLENTYYQAMSDNKKYNAGKHAVLDALGKGGGILVDSAFRAAGNTIIDKAKAKVAAEADEDRYERGLEREEEAYRRDKKRRDSLYSTRVMNELTYEDYRDMSAKDLEKQRDRINLIREIEGSAAKKK